MSMPCQFVLTAVTSDPETAAAVDAAGVDRVGIDIERMGKLARQGHLSEARISDHQLDELSGVAARVTRAELFARLNPLHAGSGEEVERALALGARALMLPYFSSRREAAAFVDMIGGRASPVLLLETAAAVERLPEIVSVKGVSEIFIGLNDLRIGLGLSHPFEVVVSDLMDTIASRVLDAGLRFGFGGVARFDDCTLPVQPDLVYSQYPRLNATSAWLARSFFAGLEPGAIEAAVRTLRQRMTYWGGQSAAALDGRRAELAAALERLKGR